MFLVNSSMLAGNYNKALNRFCIAMSVLTGGLLTAGALVTSNDAGLSIPDWPLAYGSMVPPFVGGIRYEFTHRVIAGIVATLTVVLAAWLYRVESRGWVRVFGYVAMCTVIAQAILGGMTVIFRQPIPISVAHACVAQIFFCSLISLSLFTSRWWQEDFSTISDTGSPQVRTLAIYTACATFFQLVLGAAFRHGGSGIGPHLAGAAVVTGMVFWTAGALRNRFPSSAPFKICRVVLHSLIGMQLILGGAAWWSRIITKDAPQPMPIMVYLTVAHVVFGALTLAGTVVVALVSYRLLSPSSAPAVASRRAQEAM
jgi:cytochrome c oxidase assembly protein subunit 15